ncbi:MAG: TIGR02147 family protein [Bacteriovoracaceae bacterium]|nr:TIGR02147 family protein [Bacteriovoracaceae bacterium]
MESNTPSIYLYDCLHRYLLDVVAIKQSKLATNSYRAMAGRLKSVSHSQLYQIIHGKKKFPLKLLDLMCSRILKLGIPEKRYFRALVELNHSTLERRAQNEIDQLKIKLSELIPLEVIRMEFDQQTAKPATMIIFEMLGRHDIQSISDLTKRKFLIPITEEEINLCLNFLKNSKHIEIDESGHIERKVNHLMSFNDVPSSFIRDYHRTVAKYAHDIINDVSVNLREFQSFAINIDQKEIPQAKELIRNFINDFAKIMEKHEGKELSTYNFNIQFFPITKEMISP